MALARYQFTVVDDAGNVQDGASVTVRAETVGNPLASLFSDRAGVVATGNPVTADSEGYAAFHVAGGAYMITATKGSFTRTWRYVAIGTLAEQDSDEPVFGTVLCNILNALQHIEIGGALDTTLTRVSPGIVAIEGANILTEDTGRPLDVDLTAIAALITTAYGRSFLELSGLTEAQSHIGVREVLTGNRTYYVRTDGNDSNTGLVDSAGGAFLTLQHAYNVIAHLIDCAGFSPIIQVGNGTFTAGIDATVPIVGAGTPFIRGNLSTPANCIIAVTNAHCILNRVAGLAIDVGGIEFRTATAGNCLWSWKGSNILIGATCRFGACAGDHFLASESGLIEINQDYSIVGNAINHWHAYDMGMIICQNRTITLTGTPAFSGNFAGNAQAGHYISGNTFSGSATGSRYLSHKNGVIDTAGGGANYLPGNVAGTTATGGLYL
jgi:hypothetical protein